MGQKILSYICRALRVRQTLVVDFLQAYIPFDSTDLLTMKDIPIRIRLRHWLARKGSASDLILPRSEPEEPQPEEHAPLVVEKQSGISFSYHLRHPIEILPPELLAEIFMQCLPSRTWMPESPKANEAPMLLCQVCTYWRELALSLPIIWSSLYGYLGVSDRVRPRRVSLYQLWIERSRTQPLFAHLNLVPSDLWASSLMRLFLAEIHRWGNVGFKFDDNSAKDFLAIDGGRARLLDSLSINASGCSTEIMDEIPSTFLSFPNLRRLRWSSRSTPTTLLKMSFARLTHIKLLNCTLPFNECVRFISQCPQIRDIEVGKIEASPTPLTLPTVTLAHLCSLNIGNGFHVSEMLDYFTLPSLQSFHFPGVKIQNFENLVIRSSCKLEVFFLDDYVRLTEEEVVYCLTMPCLQSLRELGIRASGMTDRLLEVLKYSEANMNGNTLPHLEKLTILSCRTTDGVFSDMVASRWRSTQGRCNESSARFLKYVSVDFDSEGQYPIDCLRLQEFAAKGLIVWLFDDFIPHQLPLV